MFMQGIVESREAVFSDDNSHSYSSYEDKFTDENENSNCARERQRSLSRNMQQQTLVETWVFRSNFLIKKIL